MIRIALVTNIRTPNNDALFGHVARQPGVDFHVLYGAAVEANRDWRLAAAESYAHEVLPGWTLRGSAHVNPALVGALRFFAPDAVVLSGSYVMPTVQLAAVTLARSRTPWAYWGEELSHTAVAAPRRAVRAALRWPVRRAGGVLAIGSRARASYVRAGVPPARVADFRYYADAEHFALPPDARVVARASVRARHAIAHDAVVVLYCGQLISRKGVDTAIRAFGRIGPAAAGTAPCVLLVVGDGAERGALQRLAGELGVADRVRFAGFAQPDVLPAYFAACDCFVLPSHAEGWGVVVGEALAAGLPVFASTRVNAAADLVRPGENGGVFEPGDDAGLATVLGSAVADPARLAATGACARASVRGEAPVVAAPRLVRLLAAVRAGAPIEDL